MPALIGLLLAVATIPGARLFGLDRNRAFYPRLLVLIGSLYVLFALMNGVPAIVAGEALMAVPFLVVAALGWRFNPWWIVGGLTAHGFFDAVHGHVITNGGVPSWWPAFCATYDIAAAIVLRATLSGARAHGPAVETNAPASRPLGKTLLAASFLALGPALVHAQDSAEIQVQVRAQSAVSIAFIQTRPVGDMAQNAGVGYGIAGALLCP